MGCVSVWGECVCVGKREALAGMNRAQVRAKGWQTS